MLKSYLEKIERENNVYYKSMDNMQVSYREQVEKESISKELKVNLKDYGIINDTEEDGNDNYYNSRSETRI